MVEKTIQILKLCACADFIKLTLLSVYGLSEMKTCKFIANWLYTARSKDPKE